MDYTRFTGPKLNSFTGSLPIFLLISLLVIGLFFYDGQDIGFTNTTLESSSSIVNVSQTTAPLNGSITATTTLSPSQVTPAPDGFRSYYYEYGDNAYLLNLTLNKSVYQSYLARERLYRYTGNSTADWQESFYSMFLNTSEDEEAIDAIIREVREHSSSDDETVELAVKFVQFINYDKNKSISTDYSIRYPYETLYEKRGLCIDKTLLLAKILRRLSYSVVLIRFPEAEHVGVGIACPQTYGNFNSSYCYIETTWISSIGWVGENNTIIGGVVDSKPVFVNISQGKVFNKIVENRRFELSNISLYGEVYYNLDIKGRGILVNMTSVKDEMLFAEQKLGEEEDCKMSMVVEPGVYEYCVKWANAYNRLVGEYNILVRSYNDHLDAMEQVSCTSERCI